MTTTVTTQAELDNALADKAAQIDIRSDAGVWLQINQTGSSSVVARGSSRVEARGSSRVEARGSSSVVARGSSRVEARGSSRVEARGSSRVEAWGSSSVVARGSSRVEAWDSSSVEARDSSSVEARGSSSVEARDFSRVVARGSSSVVAWGFSSVVAWDSSSVEARGSSSVEARGSSSVEARDSSSVVAWDSSSVEARDSSSVEALDSSSVEAWDSSRVEARKYVAVHLHSTRVTLSGGVVIDLTQLDMTDPTTWLDFHGVTVTDGAAVLYKAVDADLRAGQDYISTAYPIGETVTARDWEASGRCGHGLHFGVSPSHARRYFNGAGAPRFLEVAVPVEDLVGLEGKCKARSCTVVREVDMHGDPVETATKVTE
jgi:hypothetical protein